jgi:hypothetical protein
MKKYKVFDPTIGQYQVYFTLEQCQNAVFKNMWDTYLKFTHDQPYIVVTLNEDGSEKWTAPSGEDLADFQKLHEVVQKITREAMSQVSTST